MIVAEGKLPSDAYHAAVDNITISSKQCERSPPHSAPGTKYIFNSIQVIYPFSDWGRGGGGEFAPMDFTFITFLLYEFKATKYRTFSKSFPGTIWCSKTLFIKFDVNKANTFSQAIFFHNFDFSNES